MPRSLPSSCCSPQGYAAALLFVFVASLLALPSRAQAQPARADTAKPAVEMAPVVVTATRRPTDVRRTGRRVTVWTAEDLAAQPALSLDEVLRSAPGVELQSRAGFGVQSDYTLRGSSFKGVLLLLDGIPINDPQTGHYLSDFPVPLSEIARIEVLRGPATALYGPDAVGGAIHIITHTGRRASTRQEPAGWTGEAGAQYGAHTLYDATAAARRAGGATALSAATAWQGSDGEAIYGAGGAPVTYADGGALRTDFERQAHTLALAHSTQGALGDALGGARLYARAGMDRRNFNAYHFYTDFDSDRARSDNHTYWAQVRLRNAAVNGGAQRGPSWSAQVAAKQHEGLYRYTPSSGLGNRDYSRKVRAQARLSRRVAEGLRLTGGASGTWRGVESASLGDHRDAGGGAFLEGQWQAAPRFWINGSGRLDYDAAYGLQATPQVSLAYTRERFTLRAAAAARAVRAPTYTERYLDTEVAEPAGNLGNPALDAERSWSYEAGADAYPLAGLSLHATAFYRTTADQIDYAKLPNEDLFVARNILSARTRGLELEAQVQQRLGPARLHLTGAYTRLGAAFSTSREAAYKYALTSARHLVQGTARLRVAGATLGLRGSWKDRRARASYGVVHERLGYAWPVGGGARLGLSLEVRNLFDTDYADVFDAPLPGRWWIVGLRLTP